MRGTLACAQEPMQDLEVQLSNPHVEQGGEKVGASDSSAELIGLMIRLSQIFS
jgi:hypothetical protein